MAFKQIYFVDFEQGKKQEIKGNLSEIKGFEKFYFALSGGILPSDGYLVEFNVNGVKDVADIKNQLKTLDLKKLKLIHTQI